MFVSKGISMFVKNLVIEIFCDRKDGYPCKGGHSYPFIAKSNLSQIENFKVTINDSVIHGWTSENYQSHHCPECSSESNSLDSESLSDSKPTVS